MEKEDLIKDLRIKVEQEISLSEIDVSMEKAYTRENSLQISKMNPEENQAKIRISKI